MTLPEMLGFLASGLVLVTFGMRTMVPMRVAAIGSNLAFVAYGLALGLTPVWLLHSILLPLNVHRLLELKLARRRTRRRPNRVARRSRRVTASGAPHQVGRSLGLRATLRPRP